MSAKLVLRVEWNETVRTCRDPFDTKKFSNLSPEILVQWIAPLLSGTQIFKTFDRHMSTMFDYPSQLRAQFAGERGFQNPGVCLQAFSSFPSPTPTILFWFSPHFPRRQNTRNPLPQSFFAPKPHGNACYVATTMHLFHRGPWSLPPIVLVAAGSTKCSKLLEIRFQGRRQYLIVPG